MTPSNQPPIAQLYQCNAWSTGLLTIWRRTDNRYELTFIRPGYKTQAWRYSTYETAYNRMKAIYYNRRYLPVDLNTLDGSVDPFEPIQQAR